MNYVWSPLIIFGSITLCLILFAIADTIKAMRAHRQWEQKMIEHYGYVPTITDLMNMAYVPPEEIKRRQRMAREQMRRDQRRRHGSKARELSKYHRRLDILAIRKTGLIGGNNA